MAAPPPSSSSNSAHLLRFLDAHFKTKNDLSTSRTLAADLSLQIHDLDLRLLSLTADLSAAAAAWNDRSDTACAVLSRIDRLTSGGSDGGAGASVWGILGEELPMIVKEVARVETVRMYAETTLQLEVLVGDLEDATLSIISQASRNNPSISYSKISRADDTESKQEKLLTAIKAMKDIENILASIVRSRPRWIRLLMAVDFRVEKTLAILRPQALSDHRALLASLGWPPPLSMSKTDKDTYQEISNPLVLMLGDKKEKYSQSFLALCALQHLQAQWEARQRDFLRHEKRKSAAANVDNQAYLDHGLWTIDELVHPMASRMEYHFSQWFDQPEYIFALVYKVTRDFLDGVDNVLQPLIDRAWLVGYSAKEAWVSAMVKVLREYLTKKEFPVLVRKYEDGGENMDAIMSWLHLVDHMVTSDKKMQVLADLGSPNMVPFKEFSGVSPSLSVMSIFIEHPDWLQMWADIELKYAMDKLRFDLDDDRSWLVDTRQQAKFSYPEDAESFLLSTREDYKAPLISDTVVRMSWGMIERALALLNKKMRVQFIRYSASLFLQYFFCILLQHCKEVDFTAYGVEDNVLRKAAASVNAAQYCESVLREWGENVIFLEMSMIEDDGNSQHPQRSFFEDEIMYLVKIETDFLVETMSGVLLQFEALCWDYIQNIKNWELKKYFEDQILDAENPNVSPDLIEALDILKDQIGALKLNLNPKDFLDLWRSITDGLDRFLFSSIPLSNVKLSRQAVIQFNVDMRALFLVFRPFCVRPEAFFPCTTDSLKLLTMDCKDTSQLLNVLSKGKQKMEECLRLRGLFHLSADQAEKILKNIEVILRPGKMT